MEFASNRSGQAGDDNSYRTVPGRGLVSMDSLVREAFLGRGFFAWWRRYCLCDSLCKSFWWL
jgi:hypothetical protein